MKTNKQIKKELYEELEIVFNQEENGFEDSQDELIENNLVITKKDKEGFIDIVSLQPIEKMNLSQIENAIEIIHGGYYHIFDYHNQLDSHIHRSYKTSEYTKYQNDLAKMTIPFIQINTEDKSFKNVGTFKDLQDLKDHLIKELNEYAGPMIDSDTSLETKDKNIKIVFNEDGEGKIEEMAFYSEKWGSHHLWIVQDEGTIETLEKTVERNFGAITNILEPTFEMKMLASTLEENCLVPTRDFPIPNDWKKYDKSILSFNQKQELKDLLSPIKTKKQKGYGR